MKKAILMLCLVVALPACLLSQNTVSGVGRVNGGGSLTPQPTHYVSLSWNASRSSGVLGYNVYRSQSSGGPFTKLNSSLLTSLTYQDSAVSAGQTYYYYATAVGSGNVESVPSNHASAPVPSP